jgi:23S rRNA G2069 N7-methylase RlmK/C1962 C5-methylase RlmI
MARRLSLSEPCVDKGEATPLSFREKFLFVDFRGPQAMSAGQKISFNASNHIQVPDHPIIPTIPETEYLKGFAFELVR